MRNRETDRETDRHRERNRVCVIEKKKRIYIEGSDKETKVEKERDSAKERYI